MNTNVATIEETGAEKGCYHCGQGLPRVPLVEEVGGRVLNFCCRGCLAVCRYIHESGLEGYYDRRDGSRPAAAAVPGFDVSGIDEAAVAEGLVREAGGVKKATLAVDGIHCAACVWLIERVVGGVEGVAACRVNLSNHRMTVRWDPAVTKLSEIVRKTASIGYGSVPYDPDKAEAPLERRKNDALVRMAVAGFGTLATMFFAEGLYAGFFWGMESRFRDFLQWASLAVTLPVVFYSAMPFIRGAAAGLRNRTMTMDLPIALGALITFLYSAWATAAGRGDVYFDSACMFIFLILGGRFLEAVARKKAGSATARLESLRPRTATLVEGSARKRVPVSVLKVGDLVEVLPGEQVPLDGVVVEGASSVDESMLTGESRPVGKVQKSHVLGATTNTDGALLVEVTRTGVDTVLAGITRLVEDAQLNKAGLQNFADRVAAWFVPAILATAFFTWLYWTGADPSSAVVYAVAVLIVTCPCALALAVPAAILSGCGAAAREGILVKSSAALEKAWKATHVVFDKTGTLTTGKMAVTDVVPAVPVMDSAGVEDVIDGYARELLSVAASVERSSEHPVGRAIVAEAERLGLDVARSKGFRAVPGRGVEGRVTGFRGLGGGLDEVEGEEVAVGTRVFLATKGVGVSAHLCEAGMRLAGEGKTVVYVGLPGRSIESIGLIAAEDPVRASAAGAVARLREMGLKVSILSGDTSEAAGAVGERLGVDEVVSEVLPGDKEEVVRGLMDCGDVVLMVGDGINDGPALARADVGLAIGSGTDLAMEAADVILVNTDPMAVARAIEISRRTFSAIRQNLVISAVYNAVMMPLAAAGFIVPVVAAAAMPVSSLVVIGNSIRAGRKLREAGVQDRREGAAQDVDRAGGVARPSVVKV